VVHGGVKYGERGSKMKDEGGRKKSERF